MQTFFFWTRGWQASRSATTTRATFFSDFFPPLPQVLMLRCQLMVAVLMAIYLLALLLVVVEVVAAGGGDYKVARC